MRILFVINPKAEIHQWGRLGDTALAQYLIKELTSNHPEYKVDLVCGYPKGTEDFTPYIAKRVELGLNFIWHAFEYDHDKNLSQKKYWDYITRVLPIYDIVHVHQAQVASSKYIHEYSKLTDTPVVWTLHNPPEGRATFSYAEDYQKIVDSDKCRLVCVSKSAKDRLIRSMKLVDNDRIRYIYNGIPNDDVLLHCREYQYIGVGRIDPPKNTLGLLQFMKYMYDRFGHKSIYIGSTFSTYNSDSDYVNQCESILKELVDAGCMKWIKEATHKEVLYYMTLSSYYVNLSRVETFSLTSCEAMSVGTPVICFDEAGPGEIVPSEFGIKIPVTPRKKFSSYIEDISSEIICRHNLDYHYDTLSMRRYAKEKFSVATMAENYINLYKELIV